MLKVYIVTLVLVALVSLGMAQIAHATSDPYTYGYQQGLSDGKGNARDSTSACENYNSTSDNNECYNGYDIGFKKGCESYHGAMFSNPEYGECGN